MIEKYGRNDPCPCGSGKKYKRCCLRDTPDIDARRFQSAQEFHQAGHLPQAKAIYQQILLDAPNHPDALHFLGVLANQEGSHESAIELIGRAIRTKPSSLMHYNLGLAQKAHGQLEAAANSYRMAIALNPDYAEAHYNLGNVLHEQGLLDKAVACYRNAINCKPDYARAHCNLGNLLQEQGKSNDAVISYRNAISFKPDYAEAHYNLGLILMAQGKLDAATDCYRKTVMNEPDWADAHYNLGIALQEQGIPNDATACYRKALELDPNNESAAHMIACLTAGISDRAPSQYVEKLFDGYAEKFDSHLVNNLKYRTPAELLGLIRQVANPPDKAWDVLDLGCGTGLAGIEFAPHARQLVGVDLSTKMLEIAHDRGIYQRIVHSDLLPMMRGEETASYDVVVAADVFVYLGMLDEIVNEAQRLLRSGGYFIFSVEAFEALSKNTVEAGFQLSSTGRYTHSSDYLKKLAFGNGFESLNLVYTQVRQEAGKPVMAWLVLWKTHKIKSLINQNSIDV